MRLAAAALLIALAACGGGSSRTEGEAIFRGVGTCNVCHGADLRGTPMGPSLLEMDVSDDAIRTAITRGVPAKRPGFGAMPARSEMSADQIEAVITYIRSVQRSAR